MQFKTEKGTAINLIDLKGKAYMPVAQRLIWFREEHPDWTIEVSFIELTDKSATAQSVIKDSSGRVMSVDIKHEKQEDFYDFREKAATGATGRALGLLGYGTQFAPELDEGTRRIVDTPQPKNNFF